MFIPATKDELEKLLTVELNQGSDNADIDVLIGTKEEVPIGTAGSMQVTGKTRLPKINEEDLFDFGPGGEIIERG
jgi:hypothetical protein